MVEDKQVVELRAIVSSIWWVGGLLIWRLGDSLFIAVLMALIGSVFLFKRIEK